MRLTDYFLCKVQPNGKNREHLEEGGRNGLTTAYPGVY